MDPNTPLKRHMEEKEEEEKEKDFKKQKSYKDIITLLEEDEDNDPNQDLYLSSLISTLQDELSSGSDLHHPPSEEGENVMRHLLEASDDELGIPSTDGFDVTKDGHVDAGDLLFPGGDSLWEFEDYEAANYYNLLQSEIIM